MSKNRGWLNKMKVDDGMLAGYFNVRKEFLMKWKDIGCKSYLIWQVTYNCIFVNEK